MHTERGRDLTEVRKVVVVEVLPSLLLWYHPMAQAKGAAKDLDLYPCIECSVTLFYPMLHTCSHAPPMVTHSFHQNWTTKHWFGNCMHSVYLCMKIRFAE